MDDARMHYRPPCGQCGFGGNSLLAAECRWCGANLPLTETDLRWLELWAAQGAAALTLGHIPALIAEIRSLRAELAAARKED